MKRKQIISGPYFSNEKGVESKFFVIGSIKIMRDRLTIKNCKKSLIFVLRFLISSIKDIIPSNKHNKNITIHSKKNFSIK